MTDRELLQLAAKAAGKGGQYEGDVFVLDDPDPNECSAWNPLTDDSDALRLAVKLGFMILPSFDGKSLTVDSYSVHEGATVRLDGDACAATRRAIVRAAASIGGNL